MKTKRCTKCGEFKSLNLFSKCKKSKDGLAYSCKECVSQFYKNNKEIISKKHKKWREDNKERKAEMDKIYYEANKQVVNARKHNWYLKNQDRIKLKNKKRYQEKKDEILLKQSEYRKANNIKLNAAKRKYTKNKRMSDDVYAYKEKIRNAVSGAYTRGAYKKGSHTETLLGCSYEFFIEYIEAQFTNGMCRERKNKIHLDHIIPIATAKTKEDVDKLNHYTNFQPLWAKDNHKKGAKIPNNHQKRLL